MRITLAHLLILGVVVLPLSPGVAQVVSVGNGNDYPSLDYKGKVYIGTPTGLLTYDPLQDLWTTIYTGQTAPANRTNALGLDEDVLWIGTDEGVLSLDLLLGGLAAYTMDQGLPSDTVLCLGFEEDYVWVGTASGAARFDKLTGSWESFDTSDGLAGRRVRDIRLVNETLWFAAGGGASEYDPDGETWRTHRPGTESGLALDFIRIHPSATFTWFLASAGAARYDARTRSWATYAGLAEGLSEPGIPPSSVISEGDSLWVVAGGSILLYDPNTDAFSGFEYLSGLGDRETRYMDLSGTDLWVATDSGVGRFVRAEKRWKFYGEAQGLHQQGFISLFLSGSVLFACGEDGSVNYLSLSDERWHRREAPPQIRERQAGRVEFIGDERGTGVAVQPENELLLKGNSTLASLMNEDSGWSDPEARSDLILKGRLSGGRALAGRYDDTDLEKTVYGLEYRGAQEDIVEEVSLGQDRCEFGRDRLLRSLEIFGGSVQTGYGQRGGGLKRMGLSARAGERRSGFDADFFVGRRRDVELDLEDVDYLRGVFFALDTLASAQVDVVVPGSEVLYVDDGVPENNTANTILDTTIAGVSGDFDLLHPFLDYVLDNASGILTLSEPAGSASVVAAAYDSYSGRKEIVVRSDSVSGHELPNRYSLGADMIPRSLSMEIVDTLGQESDLSRFGLDSDLDGRVDPDLVDFKGGILTFPARMPFPEEVYSVGAHVYTMRVTYSTSSSAYSLSHRRVVRLSETVRLDGAVLKRGEDYVMDYTNGLVVMLNDEQIGDQSEIDVTYEYERESGEDFQMVDLRLDPGSSFRANLRGIRFDDAETGLSASDIIHASAELRTRFLGFDGRVPVELARGMSDSLNGSAGRCSIYLGNPVTSLSLGYRSYGRDFCSFSPETGRLGGVKTTYGFDCESHLLKWFLGGVSAERQVFFPDSSLPEPVLLDSRASLAFVKKRLPAVTVWTSGRDTRTAALDERLRKVGSDVDYTMTREEFAALPVASLALRSSLARTWWLEAAGDSSGRYDGGSAEVVSALFRGVSVGCEYLSGYGMQDSLGETSRRGEVRLNSSIDRIPGLALHANTEREARESCYGLASEERDASTNWQDYARAGISPGVWFRPLSFADFECEVSNHRSRDFRLAPGRLSLGQRFLRLSDLEPARESGSRVESFKSQVRPHVTVLLNLGYEKTAGEQKLTDSRNRTSRERYTARGEYKPRYRSTLTVYYDRASERSSPVVTDRTSSPSAWWEERWAPWIFTKAALSYSESVGSQGVIRTRTRSVVPQLSTTLRVRALPVLGDVEFTTDSSVRQILPEEGLPGEPSLYSASFELDVKTPRFLRLKTEVDLSHGGETAASALVTVSGTF